MNRSERFVRGGCRRVGYYALALAVAVGGCATTKPVESSSTGGSTHSASTFKDALQVCDSPLMILCLPVLIVLLPVLIPVAAVQRAKNDARFAEFPSYYLTKGTVTMLDHSVETRSAEGKIDGADATFLVKLADATADGERSYLLNVYVACQLSQAALIRESSYSSEDATGSPVHSREPDSYQYEWVTRPLDSYLPKICV